MTKINLLPPEKVKARRGATSERSYLWLVILLPLIVLIVIVLLYFQVSGKVSQKQKALTDARRELTDWQNKNAALQQYKTRQDQITTLETSVVSVLQGRVYWARILNNIAITIPSDIWLSNLAGVSGDTTTAGTVTFAGYALQCPNRNLGHFFGYFPDYRPVANWLERMATIPEFQKVWLSSAVPARQGTVAAITSTGTVTGSPVIQFDSVATLNMTTAAIGEAAVAPAATQAAPETTPESTPGGTGQ